LVDIFFEDVAQNVGIDLVVVAQRALVEMPLVTVKVIENSRESFVWNVDIWASLFDGVLLEQSINEAYHSLSATSAMPLIKSRKALCSALNWS
jgi:hypothetical protein